MPTKQETFDTVAKHLLTQGERSESSFGCAYRGDGGLKCAVGVLIPEERYYPDMEGASVSNTPFILNGVAKLMRRLGHDLALLGELQRVHDEHEPDDWRECLEAVAREHGLEWRL